jgi:signal transduction histidine kinase
VTVRGTLFGRPPRAVAFDVTVSGVVVLLSVVGAAPQPGHWTAALVGVGMAVALLFRRTHPRAVTAVVAALALTQVIARWGPLPFDVAVLITLYSVVKYGERLRDGVHAGVVAAVGVLLAAAQTRGAGPWWAAALWYALLTGAVWLVALNVRTRRLYVLTLEERASTLEREREAESRAAVAEERTRIARELHDVVAHHMSLIAVQAETAPYRLTDVPAGAAAEFTAIAGSARDALTDMRRLLGVLRSESTGPQTMPQPDLADLPTMVAAAERAGLPVRLDATRAEGVAVPAPVGLAAYRIVQEGLANAARHAAGAAVRVTVRADPSTLVVRVENSPADARPTPPGGTGHGLTGMRERATSLGGTFTAGPLPDGGYAVAAELPYDAQDGER